VPGGTKSAITTHEPTGATGLGRPLPIPSFSGAAMRFIYFLILLILVAAVGIFAYQNHEGIQLDFLTYKLPTIPVSLLIGGAYVLGMLSGWSVVGFLRRSIHEITTHADRQQARQV
jgi:uncharacterized integral membrane protein